MKISKILCKYGLHKPDYEEEPTLKWHNKRWFVHCERCGEVVYLD